MITINGPFIVALAVIIFLIVIKWLEWYLFQNGTFHKKNYNGTDAPENTEPDNNYKVHRNKKNLKLKEFGGRLKSILFFGKADLRRPWYVGIPFGIFPLVQSFVFDSDNWEFYQLVCIDALLLVLIVLIDMLITLRVNKGFFSIEDRRKRYVRSQIAQIVLACIVFAIAIGATQIHIEKKYADPAGLKDSIEWAIEPTYEGDWPSFTEGLAPIKDGSQYGFIDHEGKVVIPFGYKDAYNFYEGLAAVKKDRKWGYIDKKGQQIIPFLYDDALDFGDGLAPVKKGKRWVVIDKNGTVQFKTDYEMIYPYHEGVATVDIKNQKFSSQIYNNLIDKEGHLLFHKNYIFDSNFNEGCVPVYDKETGKSFFLDRNEKKIIPFDYAQAEAFSEGYAPVWFSGEEGYALIDHAGNIVERVREREYPIYQTIKEGLTDYSIGEWNGSGDNLYRGGFKDRYGDIIIPAKFQATSQPSEGLIGLKVDGLWGFVKNPIPQAAWSVDPALWKEDRTQIAAAEGLPIYAGELESTAYNIKVEEPELIGIPAYKKAFEQLKTEKAFRKYGKNIESDQIQYQIGNAYYRLLLLEKN